MRTGALLAFWGSAGLLLYGYAGYGLLLWICARFWPQRVERRDIRPRVSIVVVAFNEQARIELRIRNLLALDYPRELLEVIIASDGSTDDTVERARAFEQAVRVIVCPIRRGKPAVLNEVVPTALGDIVVLADVRQSFDRSALAMLVRNFADPAIGAVSGALVLRSAEPAAAASEGAAIYWECEKLIRRCESAVDSNIGVTGAIYALRRELYEPIPDDTILDDVLIPMRITRRGFRVLFDADAKAFDRKMPAGDAELVRKVRTIAGNVQLFARESWLLRPAENRLWLQMISHKALRLIFPVLYLVVLAANVALIDDRFYALALAGQLAFYATALIGYALPAARFRARWLLLPYTVCFLSWATILGVARYAAGHQQVTWQRALTE